ncbi:MAG TPA: hypothetical protein PLS89_07870 [Syntrophales bacterium]|nr:hypothetical protein [Syntrophales bacterium]
MKRFDINNDRDKLRGPLFEKEPLQNDMAVKALLNILIFSAVTFSVSLAIEKQYAGPHSPLFLRTAGTPPAGRLPVGYFHLGGLRFLQVGAGLSHQTDVLTVTRR